MGIFREASHGRIRLRIRISNACNTSFRIRNSSDKPCIVFNLARFATKRYSSQVENHLILLTDVRYIFFEWYNLILAEMWEEFAAQIINLGHFCVSQFIV